MDEYSLWDLLPFDVQEVIINKRNAMEREDYKNAIGKKHEKRKKKQGRSLLTPDMVRFLMEWTTEPMEYIGWAFETELHELETLIDPPTFVNTYNHDYAQYFDVFLTRSIEFMEDPENKDEWICPTEDHWLTMFARLSDFHRKHSHLNLLDERDGMPAVWLWLEMQKDPSTDLSRERKDALRGLGVNLPRRRRNNNVV
jgi:hypothetical protein